MSTPAKQKDPKTMLEDIHIIYQLTQKIIVTIYQNVEEKKSNTQHKYK